MRIVVQDEWIESFSDDVRNRFGWSKGRHRYTKADIDVFAMPTKEVDVFEAALADVPDSKEKRAALADIKRAREIQNGKYPRASNAESAVKLIACYVAEFADGFRLWKKFGDQWYGYFVDKIWFEPEQKSGGSYSPASANVSLVFSIWDRIEKTTVSFDSQACRGKTAKELLAARNLIVEDAHIAQAYEDALKNHLYFSPKVGLQCEFGGLSFGNTGKYDRMMQITTSSEKNDRSIGGKPVKVVVDTINDDGNDPAPRELSRKPVNNIQLRQINANRSGKIGNESDFIDADDEDATADDLYAPVHPFVPVFDLTRHERYAVHANDLVQYKYDTKIDKKLILPKDQKNLLKMLVNSNGAEFRDIVDGKSGGTVVLLAGRPGLGKTLSAEVFAECSQRPLYRVQCSQLGTNPDTIEEALQRVLMRAKRWNAVVLLDEADLYIGERGMDIDRNAIVCVFLRVLETCDGVLFLTTNLPETVDDAIASRCIARFDVVHPDVDALEDIWDVLLTSSGTNLTWEDVQYLSRKYPRMGGRDVKAAIKLAMVNSADTNISREAMEFVLSFHPNRGQWQADE
jgi:hypothetical protein